MTSVVVDNGVMESFSVRAERVLVKTYCGIHHAPQIHKFNEGNRFERWEVNHYGDLSTHDFNTLTRLVLSAHDECVRASISQGGPRAVKITLWPRYSRTGDMGERHPAMEYAVETLRKRWSG